MKLWGPSMKQKYFGSILSFQKLIEYDFIEINQTRTTKINKGDVYHINLTFEIQKISDNYFIHKNLQIEKVVVSFVKNVLSSRNIGILRFYEFKDINLYKNEVVYYEIYEIRAPFEIEEYFDGVFLYIKINDPLIGYEIRYAGYVESVDLHVYKLLYIDGDVCFYGEEFLHYFKPNSITSYKFSFYINKEIMQININLKNLHKINKFHFEKYILEKHNEGKDINFRNVMNLIAVNPKENCTAPRFPEQRILEEEKKIIEECYLNGHKKSARDLKKCIDEDSDDETFVDNLKYKYLNSLSIKESENLEGTTESFSDKVLIEDLLGIYSVSETGVTNLYLENQYYCFENVLLYNINHKDLQKKDNRKCTVINNEILIEEKENFICINNYKLIFVHFFHFYKNT